jgi:dipeptidyl aminopeptidase/acylaminoacyl peptidase
LVRSISAGCFLLIALTTSAQEVQGVRTRAAHAKTIDVTDCVTVRRLFDGQVEISPDGRVVAYVVKTANPDTNKNMYGLYLRDIATFRARTNGRLLLESDNPVYGLKWRSDGKKLILLDHIDKDQSVAEIDPETATRRVLLSSQDPISSFATNSTVEMIVYSTEPEHAEHPLRKAYIEYGYPLIFGQGLQSPDLTQADPYRKESRLFVARVQPNGRFSSVSLRDAGLGSLRGVTGLSLSPDGRYLVFSYREAETPEAWRWIPVFRWNPVRLGLFDFLTNTFRLAFDSPQAEWGLPVAWAMDSQSFTLNAVSPSNSLWETRDRLNGFVDGAQYKSYYHTFAVDLRTNTVTEVLEHPLEFYATQVVYWEGSNSRALVREADDTYSWFEPSAPEWKKISESKLSLRKGTLLSDLDWSRINTTSDGKEVVGVYESTWIPPEIFIHNLENNESRLLTDLNPHFHEIAVGPVENVKWKDRFGFENEGLLIKPAGYDPSQSYPLVIMVKNWPSNHFIGDTSYRTAFAPLPLASAGFVVLMAQDVDRGRVGSSGVFRKYPGRMGEYAEFEAVVESAIDTLVRKGLASRDNIGINGFSSSSWETDMLLTHSRIRFVAASSADSGLWNYSLYWNTNSEAVMDVAEEHMGGPPYGRTFRNWLRFSPAFNAVHLTTPLLMEYTDRGAAFDPDIDGMEFFVALSRQKKPVDLFFYPGGGHLLDNPAQRVSSLRRNVDWFRFWMQGYEGPAPPYDPQQYVRWKKLRALGVSQNQEKARDRHSQ